MTQKMDDVVHQIPIDKFHTVGKVWISSSRNGGSSKRQVVDFCVKLKFLNTYYFTIIGSYYICPTWSKSWELWGHQSSE